MTIWIVTTTVGTKDDARALAARLVEARLAACVQVSEVLSVFRWEGLKEEAEWRLDCKTSANRRVAAAEMLAKHHPYDLPEIVAVSAEASADYANWVENETGGKSRQDFAPGAG